VISGLFFTGMALFFALLGAPPIGIVLLAVFAIAVIVIGYRLGRRPDWQRSMRGSGARSRGSGWVLGSTSRSGSSGRSSSGSFSGGRSGGGGASGRW
jgi:uncharacterized membrane protein YgcG